jgi:hypothetical protein
LRIKRIIPYEEHCNQQEKAHTIETFKCVMDYRILNDIGTESQQATGLPFCIAGKN